MTKLTTSIGYFCTVPSPSICSLPQTLHFSHDTQSIIREIFLNLHMFDVEMN
jgi:hypothetical protein